MKDVFVIGIAGGTGSGKSTLAGKLKDVFADDVVLLCQDYYYKSFDKLSFEEKSKLNFDHPNSFDTPFLIEQVKKLRNSEPIDRPVYSFMEHRRLPDTFKVEPKRVIIIEGILIFENRELCDLMDMKIFVDTDADIRLLRRIIRDLKERGRDLDSVINQYMTTVKPMHEEFIEPSKKVADVIIPEGGMNHIAVSMLLDKIQTILNN
ncbi:MAG: uridine kinase [Deltaproteobacteria bacterium]